MPNRSMFEHCGKIAKESLYYAARDAYAQLTQPPQAEAD